jgi:hypothetical protein
MFKKFKGNGHVYTGWVYDPETYSDFIDEFKNFCCTFDEKLEIIEPVGKRKIAEDDLRVATDAGLIEPVKGDVFTMDKGRLFWVAEEFNNKVFKEI